MLKFFQNKLIITLFLLFPLQAKAEITAADIILFPLKIVTKPLVWALYGWEYKSDNYNVEITYNLELDGKPLTITNAINCQIYEGSFKPASDGIRRPTRRVVENTRQITHYLEATNEILILPVPGYCYVDESHEEEKILNPKTNKEEIKITAIKNKTKSFSKFTDKMVMSFAFAKLDKNNDNKVYRIERVVSPKYYEMPSARIRLKSYSFNENTNLEAIDSKIANRFSWINGEALSDQIPKWGTYTKEDEGAYVSFGLFKYPKEIWSKIPVINDFISKITKEDPKKELFYITVKDKGYGDLDWLFEEIRRYLTDSSAEGFFSSLGVNIDDSPLMAISLAREKGLRQKGGDGVMFVPEENRKEWDELLKISNFRDYYHPFIFDQKLNEWQEDKESKHLLIIEKAKNPKAVIVEDLKDTGMYIWSSDFELGDKYYKNNPNAIFYNSLTKELIITRALTATFLN